MKSVFSSLFVASALCVLGSSASLESNVHHIVQQGREHLPVVWKSVKHNLAKVPVTKREALKRYNVDPKTGKPFMMTLPADLYRNYDEAYINILHMRK